MGVKKLAGLLTVGAVAGGLLYSTMGTASADGGDDVPPEDDEMVVATEITELTGNQRFTFKEYSTNVAPASLNPFNTVSGGKLDIRGSSGSDNQYGWFNGGERLKLVDHDGYGWFGGADSGGLHMKVAKGFAIKVKLVSENTDYFSEFSGLSEALTNRDSKIKSVGSSKGGAITQIKDDLQRLWKDDEMVFVMYEGDYVSIDIDSEHKDIGYFTIRIDGTKYDNSEKVDDDCHIRIQNVYKVESVDAWESETFNLGSETIVFSGIGSWSRRLGKRMWLTIASKVGTKAGKRRAAKELESLVRLGIDKKKMVRGGKVTVTTIGKSSDGRLKKFLFPAAKKSAKDGGEFIGWRFLPKMTVGKGVLILTVAVGGGLYTWIGDGGLGPFISGLIAGPSCNETCNGYESGSDEEIDCLEDCISSHDKRILVLGGIAVVGGLGVSYLLLSKLIPEKKAEKEE